MPPIKLTDLLRLCAGLSLRLTLTCGRLFCRLRKQSTPNSKQWGQIAPQHRLGPLINRAAVVSGRYGIEDQAVNTRRSSNDLQLTTISPGNKTVAANNIREHVVVAKKERKKWRQYTFWRQLRG